MKNRLNKSLSRLKKEKLVKEDKELISKKISPFEFKIFKTLCTGIEVTDCQNHKDKKMYNFIYP